MGSGLVCCTNRPNTWLHRPSLVMVISNYFPEFDKAYEAGPELSVSCAISNSFRTAPSLCAAMIFGKDTTLDRPRVRVSAEIVLVTCVRWRPEVAVVE